MLRATLRWSGLRLLAGRPAAGARGQLAAAGRQLCSKPEDDGPTFKVPGYKPNNMDKRFLLWAGRFKKESDIPEYISYEMVDAAKSKVRVKFSVFMMLMTIVGCIAMVISGKQAVRHHQSLTSINLEKKALLKNEQEK
ncbi:protein FAM162A-like [Gastrophryne carolinensis]